jgi:hypothetical protein
MGTPSRLASAFLNDNVREAAKWLQFALDGSHVHVKLHLVHLAAGQEDAAVTHLEEYFSLHVERDVTGAMGVGKRGARIRQSSHAAPAVQRAFAAQINRRWPQKKPHWAGTC